MKILYITSVDLGIESGVRKKIYGQIKAMRNAGFEVSLIGPKGNEIFVEEKRRELFLGKYRKGLLTDFFNRVRKLYKYSYQYIIKNKYDAVFIRYSLMENSSLQFFKKLRNNSVKIFIEIPSYPYDFEFDNKEWYKRIMLYIDRIYRNRLKRYVDLIFTPSIVSEYIYGVRAYTFDNGIDIETISERNYKRPPEKTLRFIGVANLSVWHGYDRVIRGIAEYYKKENDIDFVFNIVGDGAELTNLKNLTKRLSLEDRIVFHGKKYGDELDEIYDNSDIAISSIGFLRQAKSLKTREACLKAIPFVAAKGDPLFDRGFKYVYFVDERDVILDVKKIYNWFSKLDSNLYLEEMYNFGLRNLGWNETFKDVIKKIKGVK